METNITDFILSSPAFEDQSSMPLIQTCQDRNTSPELNWSKAPEGTQSLFLRMTDPDIPIPWLRLITFTHWLVYNIPVDFSGLPAGLPKEFELQDGICQAVTSFGGPGYGGPCPPFGTHRYIFEMYALDTKLDLHPQDCKPRTFEGTLEGRVLGCARLTGLYKRDKSRKMNWR